MTLLLIRTLPDSSHKFAAILEPDRRAKLWLRCWIMLAAATGTSILLALPVNGFVRLATVAGWLAYCGLDWRRHLLGQCAYSSFKFMADGKIQAVASDHSRADVQLQPGSVSLGSVAWLRLRLTNGRVIVVLLTRTQDNLEQWRRFRVMWRKGAITLVAGVEADRICCNAELVHGSDVNKR